MVSNALLVYSKLAIQLTKLILAYLNVMVLFFNHGGLSINHGSLSVDEIRKLLNKMGRATDYIQVDGKG